jgi:hypothetical protein
VISQEHPFNAAAAEFARVVEGLLEGQTGRPVVLQRGIPQGCLPRRIERTSNPEDLGTNGWNEKQELTTVVLIHGLWMTPLSWEHWVARYQGQGLRVIAPG